MKNKIKPIKYIETFKHIRESLPEKTKCIVCRKEFETHAKCYLPRHGGKRKREFISSAISPNLVIAQLTTYHAYPLACKGCSNRILRFIGVVPEQFDSKVFPQRHTEPIPMTNVDEMHKFMTSKNKKWLTDWKGKRNLKLNNTAFNNILISACIEYVRKYSYIPYNYLTLKKKLNSLHNHPLDFG